MCQETHIIDSSFLFTAYSALLTQSICSNRYGTPRPHEVPVPMTRDSLDLNYKTRMSFINGMGNKRHIVIDDDNDNDDDDVDDDVIFVGTSSSRRLAKTYPDSPIHKKNRILLERYHHGV